MPKPPEKSETKPDVEIIPSEKPQQTASAEVILDAATGKPVVEAPVPAAPSLSAEDLRKMEARLEFQRRQDRKEFLDTLAKMQAPARPAEKTDQPSDEYDPNLDAIAQADWKKGVSVVAQKIAEKIADQRIKAALDEDRKKQAEDFSRNQSSTILEREKQWVLSQTPSLNDETSEEFKGYYATYNQMLSEDPTLIANPRAPRLVYREWKATDNPATNAEAERLKRVSAGASVQSRSISQPKTIKLTQEDLDFCERKGISPATYAKMKDANLKEGVSA